MLTSRLIPTIFLLFLIVSKSFSQSEDGTIYYSVNSDYGAQNNYLTFSFLPFYADFFSQNLAFGATAGAKFRLNSVFSLEASYSFAYGDRLKGPPQYFEDVYQDRGFSVNKNVPAQEINILGRFYLIKKEITEDEGIYVKSESSAGYKIRTYTNVPGKLAKLYALRIGLQNGITNLHSSNGEIPFQGYRTDSPEITRDLSGNNFSNNLNYKTLSIGFSRTKIRDITVTLENYGLRKVKYSTEIYFDLQYSFNQELDNMYNAEDWNGQKGEFESFYEYVVDENTPKQPFGARLGWQLHSLRGSGLFVGGEMGYRPGVEVHPMYAVYLLVKFGFNFSIKI